MSDVNPSAAGEIPQDLARYSRQIRFAPFGERSQRALKHSQVVLIGCGALGTVLANTLARAGVGHLRIIDRDFIELDNLQRQVLFDEVDLTENLPKAEAARRKLARINSAVEVEASVEDANHTNIERLCEDADLLLDGTDNFETRFLINDVAVKNDVPWIYGACIGAEGLVMPVLPHETPCLRCIWEDAPPPGSSPTCETAGVLAPIVNVVASLQAVEAIKILAGKLDAVHRKLVSIDLWSNQYRALDMQGSLEGGDCPCCRQGDYAFLAGEYAAGTTMLCGRNAVQVLPAAGVTIRFRDLADRMRHGENPVHNEHLMRFRVESFQVTLFRDGRAIVKGTSDPAIARGVYARYIGS